MSRLVIPRDPLGLSKNVIGTGQREIRHVGDIAFSSNTLPAVNEIPDEVFAPGDAAPHHPVGLNVSSGVARFVWKTQPGMVQGLIAVIDGEDDDAVNVIAGTFAPLNVSQTNNAGFNTDGKIQYVPQIAFAGTFIAGTKVGISGGLITASQRYADTLNAITDYGAAGSLRIIGPKDADGVLVPDNSNIAVEFDAEGAPFGFMYVEPSTGAPTGIRLFEYSL